MGGHLSVRVPNSGDAVTLQASEPPGVLATIAHELRTPLSALEMASELLERDIEKLDGQQIKTIVSGIHRRAIWMRGLMENLLTSAAIREGRLRVHLRPMDLVETVREVEAIVRPLLVKREQTLSVIAPPKGTVVEGDAHRLSQVLLNLLSNANNYADAGTEIEIAVTCRDGSVRVSVSDRGPGLPSGVMRSVFRAYDRAGRVAGEGLGIGLWVVASIVQAHGGRVGVHNRASGGATFWFELRELCASTRTDIGVEAMSVIQGAAV